MGYDRLFHAAQYTTGGTAAQPYPKRKGNADMARKRQARANGEGTLEMHGRVWRARWTVDGKTYTRSTGTSDKREAVKRLAEFTAPFRLGNERATLEGLAAKVQGVTAELKAYEDAKPATSIAAGFAAYKQSGARPDSGARTLADYEGYFNGLVDWLAENRANYTELRQITAADAEAFAADFKRNHSAGTFNKRITFFNCMWRTLADSEEARLVCNPWEKITKLRGYDTVTRRELTVDELRRVCGSAEGEMRVLLAVGIYTGLRLGDCALLEWGSVDLTRRMIAVVPRKTARHAHGKPVVIPIHAALAAVLEETPPDERKGYVMPDMADAYQREPSILTNRIQGLFSGCGIETKAGQGEGRKAQTVVGFHSLRLTFVSLAANAGAPMALIQSIVGHSSPAMTRHYFHENENALKMAVEALPDVGGTLALPDGANAVQAVPCAFCAVLDGMTLEQLRAARAELDKRITEAEARA